MPQEFKMGDPGEGISEAEIVEVHVSPGDEVEEGDLLVTIETDKATNELPSPYSGEVASVEVEAGQVVSVGSVLVTFGDGEAEAEEEEAEAEEEEAEAEAEAEEEEAAEAEEEEAEEEQEQEAARTERREDGPVPASPATRRLARELEVDIQTVEPSGPDGRVTAEDVRAAAEEAPAAEAEPAEEEAPEEEAAEAEPLVTEAPELPDFSRWGEVERVPLRGVRRATAEHMTRSWSQIPHVTHHDLADVTELEAFRREQSERTDANVTLMVLVMKAVVSALKEFPSFNATVDVGSGEIILKHYYNLGVATATEAGLIVPVVRDVDRLPVLELAQEVTRITEQARAREVGNEDLQGGTFTITNTGPIGGIFFTPIINFPEAAILGLGRTRLEVAVAGDLESHELRPRLLLPLSLSFDHRIIHGADAARFVSFLAEMLEEPEAFLLRV
ncbi:MAG: 2-oxo acid dehydrogenase subunit E2 [Actinomycetota bacterium]|nr:2-oxo acid dehydrogenase subunit E2 [Actinomycetota bacterium]